MKNPDFYWLSVVCIKCTFCTVQTNAGFKTARFCSNAPAGPKCVILSLGKPFSGHLFTGRRLSARQHGSQCCSQVPIICGINATNGKITRIPNIPHPETLAALARRHREGDLDEAGFQRVAQGFQGDWQAWAVVQVQERLAGSMAIKHGIRGFDAVHLAAALVVRDAVPTLAFTSFDGRLNQAATREGLTVLLP